MVLYAGKPLELAAITKAFATVAADDLGTMSLAIRHVAIPAAHVNAIATYEARTSAGDTTLPEDWLEEVACELSNDAGLTLWVTSCDDEAVGGYALFDDGEELERALADPDHHTSVPNAAAGKLAGGHHRELDVAALFARDVEDDEVELWVIAEAGRMLERPHKVLHSDLPEWKPVL